MLLRQQDYPHVVAAVSSFSRCCGNNDPRLGGSEVAIRLLGRKRAGRRGHAIDTRARLISPVQSPLTVWSQMVQPTIGCLRNGLDVAVDGLIRRSRLAYGLSSPGRRTQVLRRSSSNIATGLLCFAGLPLSSRADGQSRLVLVSLLGVTRGFRNSTGSVAAINRRDF